MLDEHHERAALDAVRGRVDRFFQRGDPADVLGPAADDELATLLNASIVPDGDGLAVAVEGLRPAALLAWCRFVATRTAPEPGDPHRALAVELVGMLDQVAPELAPPELREVLHGGGEAVTGRDLLARADDLLRSSVANGDADGVGQAVEMLRSLLAAMREPDPFVLLILSGSLLDLHYCGGPAESLDEATSVAHGVAGLVGPADPLATQANALLGAVLLARFRHAGAPSDLDEAQRSLERALATGPDRAPLFELSHVLYERAVLTGDPASLDAAIERGVEVRGVLPPGDVRRWQAERVLGLAYGMRHDRTSTPADLDGAIDALRASMPAEMLPLRVRMRPDQLAHDAVELITRLALRADRAPEHEIAARRDECVAAAREAAELLPDDGGVLGTLAITLRVRANPGDVDEAVAVLERLATLERSVTVLRELLKTLRERYAAGHDDDRDRDRAIEVTRDLLGLVSGDDPGRAELHLELGMALLGRAETTGSAADALAAATALGRAADGTGEPLLVVTSLTVALRRYYAGTEIGPDDDIAAEPVAQLAEMLDAIPEDADEGRGLAAIVLATAQERRFHRTGDPAPLTAAIGHLQHALRRLPFDSDGRPEVLTTLGSLLTHRAYMYWSRVDALEAVRSQQAALVAVADDDPARPALLVNLGNAIRNGAEMSLEPAHLEAAIAAYREALTVEAKPETAVGARCGLGSALCRLFEVTGDRQVLDEAITHLRHAARATDVSTALRGEVRNQLAATLGAVPRDEQTTEQLTEQIELLSEGISGAHAIARGGMTLNLAEALRLRRGDGDGVAARASYRAASEEPGLAMWGRAYAARMWGALSKADGDHAEAVAGYTAAVNLLPRQAWRGLQRNDQQRALRRVAPITSEAAEAALAAGHPETAVELLEHGRSVLWAQLMAARTDVSSGALAAAAETHPELVDELVRVRAELAGRTPEAGLPPELAREQRHMTLAHREERLLAEIAALPGVGAVTRRRRFAELATAGRAGPVVMINVSRTCHALVLDGSDTVTVIGLATSHEEVNAQAQRLLGIRPDGGAAAYAAAQQVMAEVLDWAWHTIVRPVLDTVRPAEGGRIWWCPTGPLSLVPLHVAADHTNPRPGQGALDRVVSSYTSTVTALLDGRAERAAGNGRTLIVGVPEADGRPPLAAVPAEVALVAERTGPGHTTLVGPDATLARVLAELPGHSWLHLAGHGRQDLTDPSGSCLHLHDRPLTVTDLTELRLDAAEFAFLSACETSTAADIPDEAIHPAAALQFAGFRHVIATLWPIPDHVGRQMADDVYRELGARPTIAAAHALHAAARRLRNQHPYEPSIWSSYVHWGQ